MRSTSKTIARALALLALLVLAGCTVGVGSGTTVTGSGHVITQSRSVSGFTEVALSGIGELTIQQTGAESLTVQADDNLLPLITTTVRGNRLTIGYQDNTDVQPTQPIRLHVTVKSLTALDMSGADTTTVEGINGDSLQVTLSGAADITASGTVRQQRVDLSGAGKYDARDLASDTAVVRVSGAGDATVQVRTHLEAHVSGAGTITYFGNPSVTRDVSGAGSIQQG